MKPLISDLIKDAKTFSEALLLIGDQAPDFGPYSFSRLDHGCDEQLYKKHILRKEGSIITRFGTNIGSGMHDIAELDVKLKIRGRDEDIAEVVDHVLVRNPDYDEHRRSYEEWLGIMRSSFEMNHQDYVASELEVGVNLNMETVPYGGDNTWFRGKIDYLEVNKEGVARVVDFKTYPSIHSDAAINDISSGVGAQLMGYLAMCMAYNPHIKQGYYEVYYFRFGTSRTSSYRDEEDGLWKRRYISREEVLDWWKTNQRKMVAVERKKEFLPKPSQKACQYCPFLSECSVQLEFDKDFIARTPEEVKALSNALVILDERKSRMQHATKAFLESHQEDRIYVNRDKYIGASKKISQSVDLVAFLEFCQKNNIDPAPYLNVTMTKYKKFVKEHGEIEGAINERVRTGIKTH